jgi:hypothetical protein
MTDKKTFAAKLRDHATTDARHAHPALRRYGDPTLAVVTPVNDARFGLHNLGADLPHTAFAGTGRWLQWDKLGEFDRILDAFLARVEAAESLRSAEAGE